MGLQHRALPWSPLQGSLLEAATPVFPFPEVYKHGVAALPSPYTAPSGQRAQKGRPSSCLETKAGPAHSFLTTCSPADYFNSEPQFQPS